MCLAVPGKVLSVTCEAQETDAADTSAINRVGMVDFQGSRIEVSLAFVPDAKVGDWVLVHAGYALNVLDETEAMETWQYLQQAGVEVELPAEMREPQS